MELILPYFKLNILSMFPDNCKHELLFVIIGKNQDKQF